MGEKYYEILGNIFQKPLAKFRGLWYNTNVVKKRNADVAQLVEQLIRNQQVAGSSPAISSKTKAIPMGMAFVLEVIDGTKSRFKLPAYYKISVL